MLRANGSVAIAAISPACSTTMAKKNGNPIGFGRAPMPDEAGDTAPEQGAKPTRREPPPPLVEPIAIDDVEMYEILGRYGLQPLVPLAKFEYQLVEVIAALEQRVRELDPDL
jgi:hypothetical protein